MPFLLAIHYIWRLLNKSLNLRFVRYLILCDVAFFYCEIDGTSLCLQCDMMVHVGGKRTHGRYLLFRQQVEVCFSLLRLFRSSSLVKRVLCIISYNCYFFFYLVTSFNFHGSHPRWEGNERQRTKSQESVFSFSSNPSR